MKRKLLQTPKICFGTIIVIFFTSSNILSQGNNYHLDGNHNLNDSTTFIGSTNARDFVVRTNATERLRVDKTGKAVFKKSVLVQDSMRVLGKLRVGPNSLVLGGFPQGGNDEITSSNGVILFGGDISSGLNFSDIKIGIGTTSTPVDALDVTGAIAINGFRILSAPGIPSSSNILVGHYAGASIIGGPGQGNNTFVGNSAGRNNEFGIENVFLWAEKGEKYLFNTLKKFS